MNFNFDEETPILLGRPFLDTGRTLIDVERGEPTMRVNGQQVLFNVLNELQYPKEEVVDCLMISSWDNIIHKNMVKSSNILEQELGKLNEEVVKKEGILSGPLSKSNKKEEPMGTLEHTSKLKKKIMLHQWKFFLNWNLCNCLPIYSMPIWRQDINCQSSLPLIFLMNKGVSFCHL